MPEYGQEGPGIDFRIYLGMILLRWQVITVCFLYGLLGGVIFLQVTPKKFVARVTIRSFTDPLLQTGRASPWSKSNRHQRMLMESRARNRAVENLAPEWAEKLGGKRNMYLKIQVKPVGVQRLVATVRCADPDYGKALLDETVAIHREIWNESRTRNTVMATSMLERELTEIEEQIRTAEDALFEFERLNDIRRTSLRAQQEDSEIGQLMGQRRALRTQLWMMEVQFPELRNENIGVITEVGGLGDLQLGEQNAREDGLDVSDGGADGDDRFDQTESDEDRAARRGWQEWRYQLAQLREKEKELEVNLTSDHPTLKKVRSQIAGLERNLRVVAELQLMKMKDAYRAAQIKHDAIEAAEYKWQAQNWQRMEKQAQLARLQAAVTRYENNYRTLYTRLQSMRVEEQMDADRFSASRATAGAKPVWPDPAQVLLIALAIGLGTGCGLAVLAQIIDNKVQSIQDVEKSLGIPFLGGVPFWVHSGLEKAIRPIVTEEHSIGAVEAYRALRTSIISALDKAGEKVLIFTSADSREGKTLTALNTAIMMAQMKKRILLVDMDLRRGRLHRSLGVDKEPGVCDVLKGEQTLRSVIAKTRIDYLDLAPPGAAVEDAPELLQSSVVDSFFVDVQDEYDYIVVDTSPVLRVTDTVILASRGFGCVAYVARVNHTPKPLIRYSLDVLKDARVIGMVLNSIEMHKISSLYYTYQYPNYAYYSNAYSYGYSYSYYGDQADAEGKKYKRKGGQLKEAGRSLKKWVGDTFLPMS